MPSLGFDRLLKRITDKFKTDKSGIRYGQAVLLSGDVHFSFATRLSYNATTRYEDTTPQPAHAVVAQCVASSFKKQNDDTIGFQRDGYFYVPSWLGHAIVFEDMTEAYAGWNVASGQQGSPAGFLLFNSSIRAPLSAATHDQPTMKIFPYPAPITIHLARAPDYRYRLDYLLPEAESTQPQQPNPVPSLSRDKHLRRRPPGGPGRVQRGDRQLPGAQSEPRKRKTDRAQQHQRAHLRLGGTRCRRRGGQQEGNPHGAVAQGHSSARC